MRKLFFCCLCIVFASALCQSCSDDEETMNRETLLNSLRAEDFGEELLIVTDKETRQTRSTMVEANNSLSMVWQNTDEISLFVNGTRYIYKPRFLSDNATVVLVSAGGSKLRNVEGQKVYAVFCSNLEEVSMNGGVVSYNGTLGTVRDMLPSDARWNYMYAVGTITGGRLMLNFKQMFAYVKVSIPASDMSSYSDLLFYSQNNYIVPRTFEFDIDNEQFTTKSYSDATYNAFVSNESAVSNAEGVKEFYIPIYPTDGTNAFVVAGYTDRLPNRGQVSSNINDLYFCDEPEEGIAAGELFCIDTRKPYATSTDYSYDGKVVKMESSTKGEGIRLVFMGQGFADVDIKSGKYERVMRREMDRFFSIEPFKSFRNYFASYMVYRVSKTNDVMQYAEDDFVNEGWNEVLKYAGKAFTFQGNDTVYRAIVVYNGNYVERSSTAFSHYGHFVSYVMENYPTLVCHEAGGHGFGLLADEYVESGYYNRRIPDSEKEALKKYHEVYGSFMNVDCDNENPVWSKFINDDRYASEAIGAYEGAYTYGFGVYRPTENSVMNDHTLGDGFNAPCREALYKRIRQYGDSRYKYDVEDFYAYDAINRPFTSSHARKENASSSSLGSKPRHITRMGRAPIIKEDFHR